MSKRKAFDEHAANELDLYTENTGELYPMFKDTIAVIKREIAAGHWTKPSQTEVRWRRWYYKGAARYQREIGPMKFTAADVVHCAKEKAVYEWGRIQRGEHK